MKVLAAYMLARLGGNTNPSADDLKRILGAVGAEIDGHRIELFLSKVNGKNIDELVASGKEKLASVPSVGDTSAAAPPAVVQETKEEKVEEEEEETDLIFSIYLALTTNTSSRSFVISLCYRIWDNGSMLGFYPGNREERETEGRKRKKNTDIFDKESQLLKVVHIEQNR